MLQVMTIIISRLCCVKKIIRVVYIVLKRSTDHTVLTDAFKRLQVSLTLAYSLSLSVSTVDPPVGAGYDDNFLHVWSERRGTSRLEAGSKPVQSLATPVTFSPSSDCRWQTSQPMFEQGPGVIGCQQTAGQSASSYGKRGGRKWRRGEIATGLKTNPLEKGHWIEFIFQKNTQKYLQIMLSCTKVLFKYRLYFFSSFTYIK